MLKQKKGLITIKAILGLILGVIIVVVLIGVWMQVLRLLPSETTFDEASTKNYEMLVSRVNSLIEEDKETDSIPFYLNKEYGVVGFNKGEEKIDVSGICYNLKKDLKLTNPCEDSCLCLCEYKIEEDDCSSNGICTTFPGVTFSGEDYCNGNVVLLGIGEVSKGFLGEGRNTFQRELYNINLNRKDKVIEILEEKPS